MRAFYFLIPLIMVNACNTQQHTVSTSNNNSMESVNTKNPDCPDGGVCTVEIHKNKKLVLNEGTLGEQYPEMEDGDNIVVSFNYTKKGSEGTVDGNYTENILFEIPATSTNIAKKGASLSDVNMFYEKQCYCKGEAGFYPVTDGTLNLKKDNKTINFDLQFKINKTSQVVSHISETVRL